VSCAYANCYLEFGRALLRREQEEGP